MAARNTPGAASLSAGELEVAAPAEETGVDALDSVSLRFVGHVHGARLELNKSHVEGEREG